MLIIRRYKKQRLIHVCKDVARNFVSSISFSSAMAEHHHKTVHWCIQVRLITALNLTATEVITWTSKFPTLVKVRTLPPGLDMVRMYFVAAVLKATVLTTCTSRCHATKTDMP